MSVIIKTCGFLIDLSVHTSCFLSFVVVVVLAGGISFHQVEIHFNMEMFQVHINKINYGIFRLSLDVIYMGS